MKGITLVQAFQYWIKMFAISVPIFVLMAVYGGYGKQVGLNGISDPFQSEIWLDPENHADAFLKSAGTVTSYGGTAGEVRAKAARFGIGGVGYVLPSPTCEMTTAVMLYRLVRPSISDSHTTYLDKTIPSQSGILDTTKVPAPTGSVSAPEFRRYVRQVFATNGLTLVDVKSDAVAVVLTKNLATFLPVKPTSYEERKSLPEKAPADATWLNPFGPLTTKAAKAAKLSPEESKPYSLLYTYSLIIAIVCGTAGLPHILVRFYTNPDGVAAKRTTMWVMILIGVFYVFPPVFGVIGRNLLPELYSGVGAKGTDKIVLELPRIISERYGVLGSILSGITCAGAFAAFMSTFSGLLVSMTGALAHDVYGRMLNPKASAEQRMKMFKWCAVLIGGVAVVLGSFVEPLEINFMVGQAFAIAAASYFPLLFMAVWWRKLTMKGAATGMLTGGLSALIGISLTSFSTLASAPGKTGELFALFKPLNDFWAAHPLLRILCEQPAIWAVPLAIILMVIVSKLTSKDVPEDIRMKMLVLHAPEKLGLKQEYIQEHQHGH
ncbi:MAG: cation acetate symporter [Verrucomicrobia bacterium]|nr:cation acetate symporter [Verrucomicrobiota bacterium]